MLKYKQFLQLTEGGNIQLGKKGEGGAQAAPFDSSKRETTVPDIHAALSVLHDKVQKQHGVHIFGKDKAALKTGSAFQSGSTAFLFDKNISHKDYAAKVPKTGDVDTLVNKEHKEKLDHTLSSLPAGTRLGKTTYLGWKKGADESHVLLHHPDHEHPIQVDMNHVKYDGEHPSEGSQFARSGGSLEDRGSGIKGEHHKRLINAVAKTKGMKWGPKGLKGADDAPSAEGDMSHASVSKKLFGVEHEGIKSFSGITSLIKKHIPAAHHQAIFDNFAGSFAKEMDGPAKPSLDHLRKHLGVKG